MKAFGDDDCVFSLDFIHTNIRREDFRQFDVAVGLLAVFEEGDHQAGEGDATAVESVDEAVFAVLGFIADVAATGLEIFAIGDAGDFEVGVLTRGPDFDVVGFAGGEAEIAGAEFEDAIVEAE